VIPDKIQDAILTGGPWAALFLLTVIMAATVITVMWRALRESDQRTCDTRAACDEDLKKMSEERIRELRSVVEAMNAYNRVMTEQAKAIESRASAITEMKDALTKIGIIIESNQKNMTVLADRAEKTLGGISDRISSWQSRSLQGQKDVP
jgi:methyl-accepting chemotaxis protein